MALHAKAQELAPRVRYEYDMFGWSADKLFACRSEFLEEGDDGDLIIDDCEDELGRPFIIEVASSG
ncbi:hypothetical protein Q31b_57090 [Novipirellula aureliae]|uniref:Uncharacterized protein n=1 Tax=Novipirellula aureliae TaxID=2527966 RepID=A0A5C6D9R1_9BACT|nr:hypothetical protein Q31b_57090 [Novipirellula aureliae]